MLDLLVARGLIHAGNRADVLNRGREQARHILLDKRAEMRRLLGRHRVDYRVTEVELIAFFRFRRADDPDTILDEETITRALADHVGLPFVHLDPLQLDYKLVTESFGGPFAERHLVIAVAETEQALTVAIADPWDTELLESLARFKGKEIHPVLAEKSRLLQVIIEFHGFRRSMRKAEEDFRSDLPDLSNLEQLYALDGAGELDATDQPVVRAVWYLLNYAFDQRASDIHLEPKRDEAFVRMRIDGVLHTIHRLPKAVYPAMVSRIKMLARLDIAERRRPQDGRFKTQYKKYEVELRVSSVPTAFGEKVVIRVFDPGVLLQDIEQLGFFPRELQTWRAMLGNTAGMVLVVGPTGSGKTTTLYSSLHYLHSPRINIVTLEDPIEMVHEAFNQIPMQPRIGVTFGSALKNVLRQDPDVIMVGEVRDAETAQNAIQAALTGHLVISTMHTSDAASAIGRLLDLDVLPFLLSGVLIGVVAQRLVRKVCPHCAVDDVLTEEQALALRIKGARGRRLKVRRGEGCVKCRYTGYRGRTGLFEVMPITPRISKLITDKATQQEIKREALNDGMLTLRDYGIMKIAHGETTFEEVVAVTDDLPLY
ncbi:MAG: type II/IV secretion system protein [Deltaproteobacteria bacterium]|nr:MAG: type II/IV secretion system protein [Deltaproteobacteria bacterium]